VSRQMTSPLDKVKRGLLYAYRTPTLRLQPFKCAYGIVFRDLSMSFDEVGHVCFNAFPKDRELRIEYFEVDEHFRRMGYGREMYAWVEKYAKRRGMEQIILSPNDSAVGFWQKMGFKWLSKLRFEMVKAVR
jgi:GNAT superfamily N-acetyltransferase